MLVFFQLQLMFNMLLQLITVHDHATQRARLHVALPRPVTTVLSLARRRLHRQLCTVLLLLCRWLALSTLRAVSAAVLSVSCDTSSGMSGTCCRRCWLLPAAGCCF